MNSEPNHKFCISNDSMVVTSLDITNHKLPILQISHEDDEEGGSLWQFHSGDGDYSMDKMQLVRLDTILALDPSVTEVAALPLGQTATRISISDAWAFRD